MIVPLIATVDQLLDLGVNVTVYNGQLDLICDTMGELYPRGIDLFQWKVELQYH